MPLLPVAPPPGVYLSNTTYASGKEVAFISSGVAYRQGQGRYTLAQNIEFIAGFPQKIAGWSAASLSTTVGVPSCIQPWRDNTGSVRVAVGTQTHLYYLLNGVLTDITPLRTISTGTLTNAITTTNNSNVVAIADSSQALQNGDWVMLSAASAVGGLTINGWYPVSGRSGTGYNITTPTAATSGAGPGGGTITFQYPRVTLTSPFTTILNSTTVKVTHTAHGASSGEYVDFSGASPVGGLTLNGEFQITTIIDANNYDITSPTPATSSAGPGGGSVSVTYDVVIPQTASTTGQPYGGGAYGVGAYGYGSTSTITRHNGWTLSAYGYQMLSCPIGGTIYVYDPSVGGRSYPLLNAPSSVLAMFVTPERFVVALGITANPMEMAWADQDDYTDWTTTPTNTANSGRTLVGGSYFVGGIGIRDGVSLIFTDLCCFQMNYTGSQEIYSTPQIGDNCGLVDPTAVCVEGGIAYWMSDQDFWSWNGAVTVLPTDDIRAYVFSALNPLLLNQCTAVLNRRKRQVRFYYPTGSSSSFANAGVIYQYDQQCWSTLDFGRTCGADAELLATPVSADSSNLIYNDETGVDANGSPITYFLRLDGLDISNGERNVDIFGFIPDQEYLVGTMSLEIITRYYPADPANLDGPYAITSNTERQDLRSSGKIFGFKIYDNNLGDNMRLGVPRLDVQPAGARR